MAYRILSVASDLGLLKSRNAILLSQGFEAEYAFPGEVEEKLRSGPFDLLILSVTVTELEKGRITAIAPTGQKVLDLDAIVWPRELLERIRALL